MHLLIISGPPAVGKLTVARLIAARTGYRLFHNHLSIDLVDSLFPKGTDLHSQVLRKLRLFLLEEAAKSDMAGVLFTIGYQANRHDRFVRAICARVVMHDGRVSRVALTASGEALRRRVVGTDRRRYGKITSASKLELALRIGDYAAPTADGNVHVIDTTNLSAAEVAREVIARTHLPVHSDA
ncbi:MAG: hypothetical protein ACXW4P_03825 [Thermoanaerobaculia bacterium]